MGGVVWRSIPDQGPRRAATVVLDRFGFKAGQKISAGGEGPDRRLPRLDLSVSHVVEFANKAGKNFDVARAVGERSSEAKPSRSAQRDFRDRNHDISGASLLRVEAVAAHTGILNEGQA
jgi:hypothetical protein